MTNTQEGLSSPTIARDTMRRGRAEQPIKSTLRGLMAWQGIRNGLPLRRGPFHCAGGIWGDGAGRGAEGRRNYRGNAGGSEDGNQDAEFVWCSACWISKY